MQWNHPSPGLKTRSVFLCNTSALGETRRPIWRIWIERESIESNLKRKSFVWATCSNKSELKCYFFNQSGVRSKPIITWCGHVFPGLSHVSRNGPLSWLDFSHYSSSAWPTTMSYPWLIVLKVIISNRFQSSPFSAVRVPIYVSVSNVSVFRCINKVCFRITPLVIFP